MKFCHRNHPQTPENTYRGQCKLCRRVTQKKYRMDHQEDASKPEVVKRRKTHSGSGVVAGLTYTQQLARDILAQNEAARLAVIRATKRNYYGRGR